jgi:hypothetical protein
MSTWLDYTFSSTKTPPPTSNQIRLNDDDVAATAAYVRLITNDGIDVYYCLMTIPAGSRLLVQDKNDHQLAYEYRTTAAPIDQGSYVELPLVGVRSAGSLLLNNQAVLLVIVPPTDAPIPPGPVVPPRYVTDGQAAWQVGELLAGLASETLEALQLRIKIASAFVAGYVTTPDPTWDPTTAPGEVQQATLLLCAYFWRNRGDLEQASASDPDRDDTHPWPAFRAVLRRFKDPILS